MKTYSKIKTASDLKFHVERGGQEPYFFNRGTMKFFGDRMKNYGVRQPKVVEIIGGERVLAYELFRRQTVKHGLKSSAWFHATEFRQVFLKWSE